jgi:hypothetical protein
MDIRNGSFNYNEIFEMVDKFDKEFKYAAENTILPDEPDYDSVQELLFQINKKVINSI